MRASCFACVVLSSGVLLAPPGVPQAQPLSPEDALSVGSSGANGGQRFLSGSIGLLSQQTAGVATFAQVQDPRARRDTSPSGVIGLAGPLGMIFDYSSGLPRMRGLAYSPNDLLRIEASGTVDADLDNVGARISVHFKF